MAFSNFGINGNHFKAGKLSLADDVNSSETAVVTSSAQGTVQVTTSQLTASYAKIDQLDVNTINSVTTTETTLEVSDAKIIAGLSASSGVNGLQIGGSSTDTELASVLYDGSNLDLNLAGTTYAALSTSKFEVQGVVSGSGQLQGASVAVDGAVTATSASLGTVMGSAAQLSGDLRLEGALTMDNVTISNAGAIAGATTISGSSTLSGHALDIETNADIDGTLNVAGAATLQSTLSAQSASFTTIYGSGAAQFDSTMIIQDDLTVGGQATMQDTLDVAGAATLQSTLSAQSASFTTIYGTGAAQFDSTMIVQDDLTVGGQATMQDTLDVAGAATLQSTLSVAGAATFNGAVTLGDAWNDSITFNGNVSNDGIKPSNTNSAPLGGAAQIWSALYVSEIEGSSSADYVNFGSNVSMEGKLEVTGAVDMVSTLDVQGAVSGAAGTFDELAGTSLALQSGGITAAGAIAGATSIDGSGDLTMGSITMTDFAVDSSGNTDALSLDVGGGYGDTGATISSAGVLSIDGQFNHGANIIPAANGSQQIGSAAYRYNAVYANNVYTGDFHMKNERGDWTLFEESDHIRIRNNKTGQTFKLGMSLIEE